MQTNKKIPISHLLIIAPLLKKGALLDFGCPFRPSFRPFVRHSFISAQYLEN